MKKKNKNEGGFTLIEVVIGMGITSIAALIGVYFFSDIQSFFSNSKNESQLTDARTLVPIIFESEKICTENLKGFEEGKTLKVLTMNETKVFEMEKTLDLTASKDFSEKYAMNGILLNKFIPFGEPFKIDHEGEEIRVSQGFLDLQINYSRYVKNQKENIRELSENYNVLVVVDESSKKILNCIDSFLYSPNEFCTKSLRGVVDPATGTCHNLKLSTNHKDSPAITLDHYLSGGEKKALKMFEDGILVGDFPNVISIGGKLNRYTEIVKFIADKESYYPDGTLKETLERDQVYYRASYKANPLGSFIPYNYVVEEKRNKTKKPNSIHRVEEWSPRETKPELKEELGEGNAWNWERWAEARMEDANEQNWFYKIYGKTSFYNNPSFNMRPHPLKNGVAAHKIIEQLFNTEGGLIMANWVESKAKYSEEEINSAKTFESTYYAYYSDRRLKEEIKKIENPESILEVSGKKYQFNEMPNTDSFGFISSDVKKDFPHAVAVGGDKFESVDYYSLLAPLVEVVKKQDEKIKKLKESIKELE